MASTAYDLSVRKALNQKGIDNSRIGYNNGYTTVDGQNFMRADKLYNGTSFTNQNNFNNAYNTYTAAQAPKSAATTGAVTVPRTSTTNAATATSTGFNVPKAAPTAATAVMPGSVPIRQSLESSGINPNTIGYNAPTRSVTVNNQPFTVPSQSVGGTAYATQQQYNTALNNYRTNDLQNQVYNYKPAENPYTPQINDTIAYLMDFAKQQQVSNPYTTPEYAAYAAQSDRRAQQGIRAAQESFGGSGFGRSTALGERAQGIQNGETEYLETQVIPAILAAEQQRRQQQYSNVANLLNPLASQQQFQAAEDQQRLSNLYNALSYYTNEQQRAQDNSRADASITGYYQTPEQAELYNTLIGLKNQAEAPGIGKDQRNALSAQADQVRARLQALGVDISGLGAGSTAAAASTANPFRTLQGQQLDQQTKQANLAAAIDVANLTGRVVNPQSDYTGLFRQAANPNAPLTYNAHQDAIRNAQTDRSLTETERANRAGEQYNNDRLAFEVDSWTQEFANAKYEFGEELAIKKMAQILDRDQLEEVIRSNLANEGMDQQQIDQRWAEIDAGLSGSGDGAKYDGLSQSQIIDTIKEQFSRDTPVYDKYGDQTGTERKYPQNKDAATKEAIYQSVLAYGLPDAQEAQTLLALGLTQQDIADLDKKYADASSSVPSGPGAGGSGSKPNTAMQASFKPGSGGGLTFSNGTSGYNNYYKAQKFVGTNNFNKNGAAIAQALQDGGYPSSWLAPTLELVARESAFSHTAKNPKSTARGLFQFLDGTRKNYGGSKVDWNDPYQQSIKGLQYIKDRYGDPVKALKFWDKNQYY